MKKLFVTIAACLLLPQAFARKPEVNVSLHTGLMHFSGLSAERVSAMNYIGSGDNGYTNNPYGSGAGPGIGLSFGLQHVGKRNFIAGASLGYELARSKVRIDVISEGGVAGRNVPARGRTFLNYSFLNLSPFLGYRIRAGQLRFDVTAGLEIAYCLQATERGHASGEGINISSSRDRKTIRLDVRPQAQLSVGYRQFSVFSGYAYGLANYLFGYYGGVNECYARVLRVGFGYRLQ